MNREVHVRIWERPEVRVLRATRQTEKSGLYQDTAALHQERTYLPATTTVWQCIGSARVANSCGCAGVCRAVRLARFESAIALNL
jgi:hypothetical protein